MKPVDVHSNDVFDPSQMTAEQSVYKTGFSPLFNAAVYVSSAPETHSVNKT
jgi:hypothetical protein